MEFDAKLTALQRNEFVRCLVHDILKLQKVPTHQHLNVIATNVVRRFPKLSDQFDGCTVGYRYTAFRNQLENRVWYTKRLLSMKHRSDSVKRQLDVNENENVNPKKKTRDGYGSR